MTNSNATHRLPKRMRAMTVAGGIALIGATGAGMASSANAATTTSSASSVLAKIKYCESGGNYQAVNASSGASGAYQFLTSTWKGLSASAGYATAAAAPASVQDAAALELYNQMGTSPWAASSSCWSSMTSAPTTSSSSTTSGSTSSTSASSTGSSSTSSTTASTGSSTGSTTSATKATGTSAPKAKPAKAPAKPAAKPAPKAGHPAPKPGKAAPKPASATLTSTSKTAPKAAPKPHGKDANKALPCAKASGKHHSPVKAKAPTKPANHFTQAPAKVAA